jgi:hypothetical protein
MVAMLQTLPARFLDYAGDPDCSAPVLPEAGDLVISLAADGGMPERPKGAACKVAG